MGGGWWGAGDSVQSEIRYLYFNEKEPVKAGAPERIHGKASWTGWGGQDHPLPASHLQVRRPQLQP